MARRRFKGQRAGTIYIAVMGVGMIVTLVGLTTLQIARLTLRSTQNLQSQSYARILAMSSAEFALSKVNQSSDWRTNFSHDAENSVTPEYFNATLAYKFIDNVDGDLANNTTDPVEIQGIGRYGRATAIYSVQYATSVTSTDQVGPLTIREYATSNGSSTDIRVDSAKWYGQYVQVTLPAEALSWQIDTIEVFLAGNGAATSTLDVSVYLADASQLPGTLLQTITVPESSLNGTPKWEIFSFSSATGLSTSDTGICITLGTTGAPASDLEYDAGGVSEANSHMLERDGSVWSVYATDSSIFYRIHGSYSTPGASGEFTATPGSWKTTDVP